MIRELRFPNSSASPNIPSFRVSYHRFIYSSTCCHLESTSLFFKFDQDYIIIKLENPVYKFKMNRFINSYIRSSYWMRHFEFFFVTSKILISEIGDKRFINSCNRQLSLDCNQFKISSQISI